MQVTGKAMDERVEGWVFEGILVGEAWIGSRCRPCQPQEGRLKLIGRVSSSDKPTTRTVREEFLALAADNDGAADGTRPLGPLALVELGLSLLEGLTTLPPVAFDLVEGLAEISEQGRRQSMVWWICECERVDGDRVGGVGKGGLYEAHRGLGK